MAQIGSNHGDVRAHVFSYEVYDEVRAGLFRVVWDMIQGCYYCQGCNSAGCFHAQKVASVCESKMIPGFNGIVVLLNRG